MVIRVAPRWAAIGLALVLQAVPGVVAGQSPAFHAELATSNTYYWRGIRRAGAGIEPAVALGLVKAPLSISVGGWAHRTFEDRHHSLDLDPDGLASAEESAWGSFDFAAPGWLITVGGIDTRYRPRESPARQVGELFGRIEWLSSMLSLI